MDGGGGEGAGLGGGGGLESTLARLRDDPLRRPLLLLLPRPDEDPNPSFIHESPSLSAVLPSVDVVSEFLVVDPYEDEEDDDEEEEDV